MSDDEYEDESLRRLVDGCPAIFKLIPRQRRVRMTRSLLRQDGEERGRLIIQLVICAVCFGVMVVLQWWWLAALTAFVLVFGIVVIIVTNPYGRLWRRGQGDHE